MARKTAENNLWTVAEAARWSGIPYRSLLVLMSEGRVPCIRIGRAKVHNMGRGKKPRRRSCTKFLVPRLAFVNWFETLAPALAGSPHGRTPRRASKPAA